MIGGNDNLEKKYFGIKVGSGTSRSEKLPPDFLMRQCAILQLVKLFSMR